MIAVSMVSLTVIGALIAGAAWMADRACRHLGLPRRWTWLLAMLAMCAAPLLPDGVVRRIPVMTVPSNAGGSGGLRAGPADASVATGSDGPADARAGSSAVLRQGSGFARVVARLRPLDGALMAAWGLTSFLLLAITAHGARGLASARRRWQLHQRESFASSAVWVSDDEMGPAAFGTGRAEIVIPRWALSLPPIDRRLLLLHERSHVEAQDPRLLAIGLALVIVVPWLVPLRWAFRRLQRAIEQDCDRRVLRRPQLARRYAELLLHVAERGIGAPGWSQRALSRTGTSVATMTSLCPAEAMLESRIRGMVQAPVTWRSRAHASSGLLAAALLGVVAGTVPVPQLVSPVPAAPRFDVLMQANALSRDEAWARRRCADCRPLLGDDSVYFARNDSLVMDAIARTRPELLRLAATATPYVAVALTPRNEVVSQSIRAGAPPRMLDTLHADTLHADARIAAAVAQARLAVDAVSEAIYAAKMELIANEPASYLDSLGISHLRVNDRPLTVLWMRFKERSGE
ncbi:MAG: hypothetical protein IT355_01380 [Gemmatimonadaceae bacterium]|nr:hypothetical protein [Gemmatimonadaceae bacterium]